VPDDYDDDLTINPSRVEHVACLWENRDNLVGISKRRRILGTEMSNITKLIHEVVGVRVSIGFIWLRMDSNGGFL
jgi:hypothetical protein